MGTFRDYLIEYTKTPEDVAEDLLRQCMPFINAVGEVEFSTVLYRGTNAKIEDFVPRERKEAGGVTGNYTGDRGDILRDFFKKKCRINLDTIIFTTANATHAKTFGNPYIVFPVGAFKFAYSRAGIPLPHIKNEQDLAAADFVCGIADDMSDDGIPDPRFQAVFNMDTELLIDARAYYPIGLSYWKANGQKILEGLSFR